MKSQKRANSMSSDDEEQYVSYSVKLDLPNQSTQNPSHISYNVDLQSFKSISSDRTHNPAINQSFPFFSDTPASERLTIAGEGYLRKQQQEREKVLKQ